MRYAIDPKAIASGKLPAKAPVVTSAANPHYQKHFDKLFAHAKGGEWDAVRDYKITGSNSYSKMIPAKIIQHTEHFQTRTAGFDPSGR